jgi:peptidoglycan/xylan/chitin deacetylase (PgdA/CDA1 family)
MFSLAMLGNVLTVPLYHHVADRPVPATAHISVTTRTEHLHAHLDRFTKAFDIIDLETVLTRRLPKRPLLLTFDDCFRSMLTVVAPILRRRGLPAVVFLNPDPIERGEPMFDHILSVMAERAGLQALLSALAAEGFATHSVAAFLNGAAITLDGQGRRGLAERLSMRLGMAPDALAADLDIYLTAAETAELAAVPGIAIGNHTAGHVRCRALSEPALRTEILTSRQRLVAMTGQPVRAFSFPYGALADATPSAMNAIAAAGHDIAFLAQGRRTRIASRPGLLWDRMPLDGTTPASLIRRLMVEPLVRGLKDTVRTTLPAYLPAS